MIYSNVTFILFSCRKGSVIASTVITLDRRFEADPSTLVDVLNTVDTLDGYRFDKSYTNVKGTIIMK